MRKSAQSKDAFTLVEVVLSLLVFGIGVLAVLGLFPGGLLLSKRSHSDTYVSEFAEMALNSLGTELELNQAFWETNDAGFASMITNYYLPTPRPIESPWLFPSGIWMSAGSKTLEYRLASDTNITDRALRYQFTVERSPGMMDELLADPTVIRTFTRAVDPNTGQPYWITNAYFCIHTSQLVRMDEHIIKGKLTVQPGLYGTEGSRYYFRYYFDYKNKKRQGY